MIKPSNLFDFYDGIIDKQLTSNTKESCKKISNHFCKLIHKEEENVFSIMASEKKDSLSKALKITIPGENVTNTIELIRKGLIEGIKIEEISKLYFKSINETLTYLDFIDFTKQINIEDAFNASIAFYETYAIRLFKIDEKLYDDVKNKVAESYKPFFKEYLKKYREEMKELMNICSFGAERNYEANYRKATYKYIETLLCYLINYAYRLELCSSSFVKFTKELTKEIVNDAESFYQLWLKTNNQIIENAFSLEEFSDIIFDFSNTNNELICETKALYEINIGDAPIAKESDLRELYKKVYELTKELDEVKKELKEVKGC